MTKEEFYKNVNRGRYPKYVFEQIKEGCPEHDCSAIVCTESDKVILAKYENGKWQQVHFTSTRWSAPQKIYYDDIEEGIKYWTDGEATDCSRKQNEE